MINNIEHEFYTEKYGFYPEEAGEEAGIIFRAVLNPAGAENRVSITVPDREGLTRVEICTRKYDNPSAAVTDFPTLEYLYIPAGITSIFIETGARRKIGILPDSRNAAVITNLLNCCKVEISPDNPYFCVYENGVYSKDMTMLYYIFLPEEFNGGSFEVPARVKQINCSAGRALRGLCGLTIRKGVTEIGDSAFESCFDLEYADIGAKGIGSEAFLKCKKLKSVKLLRTNDIGGSAFKGCISLKEIKLPDSLHIIGGHAFLETGIKKLTVPYSVKELWGEICSKNTLLEIYIKKNGALPFEYNGNIAETGTLISVRSCEKGEKDKPLFEFVILQDIGIVFQKDGVDFSEYDATLKRRAAPKNAFHYFRYDELPVHAANERADTETTMLAAWARVHCPYKLDAETREFYRNYVAEKGEIFLMLGIYNDITADMVAEYKFLDMLGEDALLKLIDCSAEEGRTEITAVLLQKLHERKKK